jgi:hypothetical protein
MFAIALRGCGPTRSIASSEKSSIFSQRMVVQSVRRDVKFGAYGEWAKVGVLQTQFQRIKSNSLDQFREVSKSQVILAPSEYNTGNVIYPYAKALK